MGALPAGRSAASPNGSNWSQPVRILFGFRFQPASEGTSNVSHPRRGGRHCSSAGRNQPGERGGPGGAAAVNDRNSPSPVSRPCTAHRAGAALGTYRTRSTVGQQYVRISWRCRGAFMMSLCRPSTWPSYRCLISRLPLPSHDLVPWTAPAGPTLQGPGLRPRMAADLLGPRGGGHGFEPGSAPGEDPSRTAVRMLVTLLGLGIGQVRWNPASIWAMRASRCCPGSPSALAGRSDR